jgi:hypothetical protein
MNAQQPAPAMRAWINGIGFIAPGMPDWADARAVLRGEQAYVAGPSVLPVPALLPSAERRRASRVIKLSLGLGLEAVANAGADGHNCHALCEQLATDDRQLSPTRFHNSVHNAAAGYWGIATRCMAPCQVIGAFDASLGAGLLDAMAQVACTGEPVLLVAYDSEYPQPLFAKRDTPDCAGVALVLSAQPGPHAVASVQLRTTRAPAATMADPALETLRQQVPAMRALPLLQQLARGERGALVLDYLAPLQLELDVTPC